MATLEIGKFDPMDYSEMFEAEAGGWILAAIGAVIGTAVTIFAVAATPVGKSAVAIKGAKLTAGLTAALLTV